jgi:putative transposase
MRRSPGRRSGVAASVGLAVRLGVAPSDVLSLYLRLLPADFFVQLREEENLDRQNNRIYTDAVVIWLMILQRLAGNGTLETAVLELLRTLPGEFWPQPCKRLQAKPDGSKAKLSSNTASYNQARQELALAIVEQCGDRTFLRLIRQFGKPATAKRDAFFIDGSSVRMPHTPELYAQYPPGSNQYGEAHWPLLRILVAHDLYTGLAMRPQWGPMSGAHAVSEQALLEQAIDRLPAGCVVLGDANFGVFSVAYAATERGHPVVLRLTMARARALAKGQLRDGMDLRIGWKPSSEERRKHPEVLADACVQGRLIVRQVQPNNGGEPFLLALFTTLEDEADSVLELYGQRWNIETDLRSLKAVLQLRQLNSTTPEMVAKEINVAMMAYNLVRAVTCVAAQNAGLKPRQFSFTRVRNVINAFAPLIAEASDESEAQQHFDRMMYYVNQAKLPRRRTKRPSYPRQVWPKTQKYPKRKPSSP